MIKALHKSPNYIKPVLKLSPSRQAKYIEALRRRYGKPRAGWSTLFRHMLFEVTTNQFDKENVK